MAFIRKSLQYAQETEIFQPAFLDMTEMQRELQLVDQLNTFLRALDALTTGLDDTSAAAGSNLYAGSLLIYQTVKLAAKSRVPGAQAAADDLAQRFPGRPKASTTATPTPTPNAPAPVPA